ncbi:MULTISPECIES: glycosyltransferase family 2 protein [unclassified Oceanobacter]|uniref:glycosyltransferase family 2 protein n=1 Tax=unclassified Oceanobacter TaxID=2620260 RepID=UPI0027377811|nr:MULTISPECIES: glycosyltransferase family 2 protein [unclassified Oceanobacter]MDP2610328.1 glycosyltransferase family 2 protein [Oceanobacter sp. 1_MG-2023]MDP2613534.1 glycosyltransferase family 2 protein [Oceanobacter sp. 2_MG-2023]
MLKGIRKKFFEIDFRFSMEMGGDLAERDVGHYTATGSDPQFYLPKLLSGWYMIELCINSDIPAQESKFYYDVGDGCSEENSYNLIYMTGKLVKRVAYFPKGSRVRFDPMSCQCNFDIEHFSMVKLSSSNAKRLIDKKLASRKLSGGMSEYNEIFKFKFSGYSEWMALVEGGLVQKRLEQCNTLASDTDMPMLSVVIPVYKPDLELFRRCVQSVLSQSYQKLELCLADDCSGLDELKEMMVDLQSQDNRVKVVFREQNGHISVATNDALALATGDYIVFMDHDDELSPYALEVVADEIVRNPEADIFYSDEDKIDALGRRIDPHFKSGFDPERILAQNYMSHMSVIRTDLVRRVGGLRKGVEGSQDHDLVLRCLDAINWNRKGVIHIPFILYHWRMVEGSTALASDQKSYTAVSGLKAVSDVLSSNTLVDSVEPGDVPNTYRVIWKRRPDIKVSIIMPTKNGGDLVRCAVESIYEKTTHKNFEIILVDNNSDDPKDIAYFKELDSKGMVRLLEYPHPFNYSAINNYAVRYAQGDVVVLLNNDVEVIDGAWLEELVAHAMRPGVGCVGGKLLYSNGLIQHAGILLGSGGVAGHQFKLLPQDSPGEDAQLAVVRQTSAVTAACLAVKKTVFDEVEGFDEDHLAVAFNDVDFCVKVHFSGYRNIWTPHVLLYHHESLSRGYEDTPEKQQRFASEVEFMQNKWGDRLKTDEFYNNNLSLIGEKSLYGCRFDYTDISLLGA